MAVLVLFNCPPVKLVWQVFLCAFGLLRPLDSAIDLPGYWINYYPVFQRKLVFYGGATVCWMIWKTRHDNYFKCRFADDPANVVYRLCNMINLWEILNKGQGRKNLEECMEKLKLVIREAYSRNHGSALTTGIGMLCCKLLVYLGDVGV